MWQTPRPAASNFSWSTNRAGSSVGEAPRRVRPAITLEPADPMGGGVCIVPRSKREETQAQRRDKRRRCGMTIRSIVTGTITAFAFAVFLLFRDAYADEPLCNFSSFHTCSLTDSSAGGPCVCELSALWPLQGAVGMKEVD